MIAFVAASGQTKNIDTAKAKVVMIKAEIKPQIKLSDKPKLIVPNCCTLLFFRPQPHFAN